MGDLMTGTQSNHAIWSKLHRLHVAYGHQDICDWEEASTWSEKVGLKQDNEIDDAMSCVQVVVGWPDTDHCHQPIFMTPQYWLVQINGIVIAITFNCIVLQRNQS